MKFSTSNSGRMYFGEDYERLITEINTWIVNESKKITEEEGGEIVSCSHSATHYRSEKAGGGTITGYVGSVIILWKK